MMIPLLALSLATDAFAVSVSCGMTVPNFKKTRVLWLAMYFGVFQMGMTLLGALLGGQFSGVVGELGRIIAFLLLAAIGSQMLWSALREKKQEDHVQGLTHVRMLFLAVATSIDAAAAGVSLGLQHTSVFFAGVVIGLTAFGCSVLGGLFGERVGTSVQKQAEILGGLVLIALGVRNLFG